MIFSHLFIFIKRLQKRNASALLVRVRVTNPIKAENKLTMLILILKLMLICVNILKLRMKFVCLFLCQCFILISVLIFDKKANTVFKIPVRSPPACRRFPEFVFVFGEIFCFSSWGIFFTRGTGICSPCNEPLKSFRVHFLSQSV